MHVVTPSPGREAQAGTAAPAGPPCAPDGGAPVQPRGSGSPPAPARAQPGADTPDQPRRDPAQPGAWALAPVASAPADKGSVLPAGPAWPGPPPGEAAPGADALTATDLARAALPGAPGRAITSHMPGTQTGAVGTAPAADADADAETAGPQTRPIPATAPGAPDPVPGADAQAETGRSLRMAAEEAATAETGAAATAASAAGGPQTPPRAAGTVSARSDADRPARDGATAGPAPETTGAAASPPAAEPIGACCRNAAGPALGVPAAPSPTNGAGAAQTGAAGPDAAGPALAAASQPPPPAPGTAPPPSQAIPVPAAVATGASTGPADAAATLAPPLRPEPDSPFGAVPQTGRGQTVAVIDTGWSPAFDQTRIVFDHDFAGPGSDPDASVPGLDSHGAWVAESMRAVAPEADILHLKVFPDGGGTASLTDIEEALDFVLDFNAVFDVTAVNLSLGAGNTTTPATTMLSDEFAALDAAGILTLVAAGNDGETYPQGINILAADPNAVAVSAVDGAGAFAGFSQRDPELTDIAALGVRVPVETVSGQTLLVSGTSFATPIVAGIAVLLQQASERLTGARLDDDAVIDILQRSGDPVAGVGADGPEGYRVAGAEAALDFYLDNVADYGDPLFA